MKKFNCNPKRDQSASRIQCGAPIRENADDDQSPGTEERYAERDGEDSVFCWFGFVRSTAEL
jgi:hypothetical protein